jgi:hypothetical protein
MDWSAPNGGLPPCLAPQAGSFAKSPRLSRLSSSLRQGCVDPTQTPAMLDSKRNQDDSRTHNYNAASQLLALLGPIPRLAISILHPDAETASRQPHPLLVRGAIRTNPTLRQSLKVKASSTCCPFAVLRLRLAVSRGAATQLPGRHESYHAGMARLDRASGRWNYV